MKNISTHSRLVVGSNPTEPTRVAGSTAGLLEIRELLGLLLGTDGRRKLELRQKTNQELFKLYDAELVDELFRSVSSSYHLCPFYEILTSNVLGGHVTIIS